MIPKGYICGLHLANNASYPADRLDFAPGEAASDDASPVLLSLSLMLTKDLAAVFAPGSGNGMRCSGTIGNVTYHYYLVGKTGGTACDVYAHTSPVASVALAALQAEPGGVGSTYIYATRIHSLPRISGAILRFNQFGNYTEVYEVTYDYFETGIAKDVVKLPTLTRLPDGIVVEAKLRGNIYNATKETFGLVRSVFAADIAPNHVGKANLYCAEGKFGVNEISVMSNASKQVALRVSENGTQAALSVAGWTELR